jgi:hypothetical protein
MDHMQFMTSKREEPMQPTRYTDINDLLVRLQTDIQGALGSDLIGFYLYGSLVWGDFDHDISDIDLLAVMAKPLDDTRAADLKALHETLASVYPAWRDRIETQYFTRLGLQTFKEQASSMGNISPGEPFHIIQAGKAWLMNWYFVQTYGITLFGPPPETLITPISQDEFLEAVREHALFWRDHVIATLHSRPYQSYAILTLCRARYTLTFGQQVSKKQAAEWAQEHYPAWATLRQNALIWRKDHTQPENESTYPETERFVHFMIDQIASM